MGSGDAGFRRIPGRPKTRSAPTHFVRYVANIVLHRHRYICAILQRAKTDLYKEGKESLRRLHISGCLRAHRPGICGHLR
jgi:hypothetical protein